jgi:hypothetical protein
MTDLSVWLDRTNVFDGRAEKFLAIKDYGLLRVEWMSTKRIGTPEPRHYAFRLVGLDERNRYAQSEFEALARRCGLEGPYPGMKPLEAWLFDLQTSGINAGPVVSTLTDDGRVLVQRGTIWRVCQASAILCKSYESLSLDVIQNVRVGRANQAEAARVHEVTASEPLVSRQIDDGRAVAVVEHGTILRVCQASADFCRKYESLMLDREAPEAKQAEAVQVNVKADACAFVEAGGKDALARVTTDEDEPARPAAAWPAESQSSNGAARKKPGPKAKYEAAMRLSGIVDQVAPEGDWRSKWEDICEALDNAEIPSPGTWLKNPNRKYPRWSDCRERNLVLKTIQNRLKVARQRQKANFETLS